jgi:hypothetical protein
VRLEGLGQINSNDLIGNRTRDLPACSIVLPPLKRCVKERRRREEGHTGAKVYVRNEENSHWIFNRNYNSLS